MKEKYEDLILSLILVGMATFLVSMIVFWCYFNLTTELGTYTAYNTPGYISVKYFLLVSGWAFAITAIVFFFCIVLFLIWNGIEKNKKVKTKKSYEY